MNTEKNNKIQKQKVVQKEKKKRFSSFRRYFWIGLAWGLVLVVVGIIFFWNFLSRPSVGVIHYVDSNTIEEQKKIEFERFEGNYISFRCSSEYLEKRHSNEPDGSNVILESALFAESSLNSKKIAMTIENLEGKAMEDSANYNMRISYPQIYEKKKISFSGLEGITFNSTKDGLFERIFFIPRDGFMVDLAFTSPIQDDEKWEAEIEDVLKSIQWKK